MGFFTEFLQVHLFLFGKFPVAVLQQDTASFAMSSLSEAEPSQGLSAVSTSYASRLAMACPSAPQPLEADAPTPTNFLQTFYRLCGLGVQSSLATEDTGLAPCFSSLGAFLKAQGDIFFAPVNQLQANSAQQQEHIFRVTCRLATCTTCSCCHICARSRRLAGPPGPLDALQPAPRQAVTARSHPHKSCLMDLCTASFIRPLLVLHPSLRLNFQQQETRLP